MDPITIFGAITGGVSAASEVADALGSVISKAQKIKAAPHFASATLRDVQMMRRNLLGFQNLQDGDPATQDRLTCIPLEDAKNTFLDCITSLDQLEDVVRPLADPSLDPLSMMERLRWTMKDEKIGQLSRRVHNGQGSLGLMLTILHAESLAEVQKAIMGLSEVTAQIAKDVARLNARHSAVPHEVAPQQPNSTSLVGFRFDFEDDLETSRPYQRVPDWSVEDMSFRSSVLDPRALSLLSKCSLGDVSSMSVIALPIYLKDFSNTRHYSLGQTSAAIPSTQSVLSVETRVSLETRVSPADLALPSPIPKPTGSSRLRRAAVLMRSRRLNSEETKVSKSRDMELNRIIRADEKQMCREVKLLLLGAGESGKSTLLKQMKLIYNAGFSRTERLEWRPVVFSNIIQSFRLISSAMVELDIDFANKDNEENMAYMMNDVKLGAFDPMPPDFLLPIKQLWQDPGVQQAIARGNEFALHDNLEYFYEHLDRIWNRDYVPNDQDLFRTRLRTTGISETVFDVGQLTYRIFDIGGQRSERKKWIHHFENVHYLLFVVDICGYDQCLVEDKDGNRMNEALMMWESTVNSPWFTRTCPILLLNNINLFKKKITRSPITAHGFTDYYGPPDDWKQASEYFMNKFRALNRNPERELRGHFVDPTDTNLLKNIMMSVSDEIIQRNLKAFVI